MKNCDILYARGATKAGQHSAFAIVDSTHLCMVIESMECPDDSYWPPGDGE